MKSAKKAKKEKKEKKWEGIPLDPRERVATFFSQDGLWPSKGMISTRLGQPLFS